MITRKCILCSSVFDTNNSNTNHKYCDSCAHRKCEMCDSVFRFKPMSMKPNKFCSKPCYYLSIRGKKQKDEIVKQRATSNTGRKTGEYHTCNFCKKNFYMYPSRIKLGRSNNFCTKKCFISWSRTSDNPEWKGDAHPENKRLRDSRDAKKWRKQVFLRDNFTCVLCGYKSKGCRPADINADHIKSWAKYPELRFGVNNGRTLCRPCHYKTPTWGMNAKFQV